jgi:hypothetical protein
MGSMVQTSAHSARHQADKFVAKINERLSTDTEAVISPTQCHRGLNRFLPTNEPVHFTQKWSPDEVRITEEEVDRVCELDALWTHLLPKIAQRLNTGQNARPPSLRLEPWYTSTTVCEPSVTLS